MSHRDLRSLLSFLFLVGACGGDAAPLEKASVAAASAPAAPAAIAASTAGEAPQDPFGYYFLDPEKPMPEWAAALDHLHLSTIDMKGDQMVTVPLYGFLRPKTGDDYPLENLKQDGARLTFTTREVNGASFDFDGRFLQNGNFPEAPPEGIVLTGRLRRLQGGRAAGEMNVEFVYTAGD